MNARRRTHRAKATTQNPFGSGLLVLILAVFLSAACSDDPTGNTAIGETPTSIQETTQPTPETAFVDPNTDYSKFTHTNETHARMPCLVCHTREDNSAKIAFPGQKGHIPCASCHTEQFADPTNAMCTICHTDPGTGAMKASLQLKTFGAKFQHAKHVGETCSTCHSSNRGGVATSIPAGTSAHTTCFQCHTAESEIEMASCSVCHEPGRLVRSPEWRRAYNLKFSHAKHAIGRMNCATCHTYTTRSARGQQVTSPTLAMHFSSGRGQSCATCHNGKQAFGAEDFTNCKLCHVGDKFTF